VEDGEWLGTTKFGPITLQAGGLISLGSISVTIDEKIAPALLRLRVRIRDTPFENDWRVWLYPAALDPATPEGVRMSRELDDDALAHLAAGGRLVWLPPPGRVESDVALGFSPVFWNTSWTRGQPPHTLGLLCDPEHPALASFPTDYHSDWQWWYLVSRAAAFSLDTLPAGLRPIVHVIDDWFTNRRLGLVFEAKVGAGKLLVSSIDLDGDLAENPVARQMRKSLLDYAASDAFAPEVEVDPALLHALVREPSFLERLGATVTADSAHEGFPASHAIDGDPATIWHTPWGDEATPMPHMLTIAWDEPVAVTGVRYVPRQDMANGRIADYSILVATRSSYKGPPTARGTWPNTGEEQIIRFAEPVTGRFLTLIAASEVNGNFFAAVAELDVITD